jgi:type II secretory pathway component PulF
MTAFAATFIDREGRRRTGTFNAHDVTELHRELRAQALWPVRVQQAEPDRMTLRLTIPVRDFVPVLHQLELQLRAGVTADEALRQLAEDAPVGAIRTILTQIHREVSHGNPIHQACRAFPRLFPPHVAAVIEAGERSAQLPEALRSLAHHLTGADELRRTAKRAMIYPIIVLSATTGLVGFLLGGVVPRFAEIFTSLHLTLPTITVLLIRSSEAVRSFWPVLLFAVGALAASFWVAAHSPRLRYVRDAAILRIPILGDTIRHLATARFAAHCRLLHDAGIPLLDALVTGAALTGHAVLSRQLLVARESVALGRPLYAALPKGHAFPPFLVPALKAGETTGQLSAALRHIEEYASGRARERLATALSLLEPILLGALAGVVGTIALSFFLPLVSLLGGVSAR